MQEAEKNQDCSCKIEKVFNDGKKTVPVVFATDSNFMPYLYVAIQSLVDNASDNNNYDIVILCTEIEKYTQNQFKELNRNNISVRFFDMAELMSKYKEIWYTHWTYTEAMYYRFFIPQLFTDYLKVLYLDCDITLNCDIAELYDIDLEGKTMGAAAGLARQHAEDQYKEYIETTLNIKKEHYFNSGVLIFDIKELKENNFFELCINTLKQLNEPLFPDQDVLNLIFKGNVKYLNCTYNFTWNVIHRYKNPEEKLSGNFREDFIKASPCPKIVHYAGGKKPWKCPHLSYADYFWKYARKTPFYEEIIFKNCKSNINKSSLYNVVYRKRIYMQYVRCKILKTLTFGKKRKHYASKAQALKIMVQDYRKILKNK